MASSSEWAEPGAHRVTDDVVRVPLPLPNDGLRAVNVYVVVAPEGLTLVDAGWAIDRARTELDRALASLGASLHDVRRFLVTHVHRDHYTLAVTIREELGIPVGLGAGERPTLEFLQQPGSSPMRQSLELLRGFGAAPLADRIDAAVRDPGVDRRIWASPDEWLRPGSLTLPGNRRLEAVATPGHTAGHLVFHDTDSRLLFAGDHVLPTITPSIGFEPVPTRDPLGAFLASLALVRSRPDAMLLPAHGPVAPSVHARVDELLAHHEQRLAATADAVTVGAGSAADAAAALRWTRRGRRLDELDDFNAMLAVFETAAHLRVLVTQGRVPATVLPAGAIAHERP